jgi:predicted glycosyltransferase
MFLKAKVNNNLIWIDLDNSPHVVLFDPIIRALQQKGYSMLVSARDCFQVIGMAKRTTLDYTVIGKHFGKNKLFKLIGLFYRGFQLLPLVFKTRPILAVSHGSRSQLFICNVLGIKSVFIYDYEHATEFFFTQATWYIAPEIVVKNAKNKYHAKRLNSYPGIKEDVYIPNFTPKSTVRKELGVSDSDIMVTLRPPATEAHYHNPESEALFDKLVTLLVKTETLRMVVLPRSTNQADSMKRQYSKLLNDKIMIIPTAVLDGLNLIWFSDFVVSGGGTMNREAAALGVPVYSIFRGTIGEIDRYLVEKGRLILIESIHDLTKITISKRSIPSQKLVTSNDSLNSIVDQIIKITVSITSNPK